MFLMDALALQKMTAAMRPYTGQSLTTAKTYHLPQAHSQRNAAVPAFIETKLCMTFGA